MYDSIDVAQWFLDKGKEKNIEFNVQKINKIVILAHFWYIGYYNKPLVIEFVEQWKYGPMIHDLYKATERYKNNMVPFLHGNKITLDEETEEFLEYFFSVYSYKTGVEIASAMNGKNSPGEITRENYNNLTGVAIPLKLIREHYRWLITSNNIDNSQLKAYN